MATAAKTLKPQEGNSLDAVLTEGNVSKKIWRRAVLMNSPRRLRLKLFLKIFAFILAAATIIISLVTYSSYVSSLKTVDERLRNGYLTSQPGVYAAPQTLRVGRALDDEKLITLLRQAGYVEGEASNLWNGSFRRLDKGIIEVAPRRYNASNVETVQISFDENKRISRLSGDNRPLETFALEPELLTSNPKTKTIRRDLLRYHDLPPILIDAITAIEDRNFFEHQGFDFRGVARATWKNIALGRFAHGGSTLTQQLVKNTYLNSDRTFARKYNELLLSLALEKRLSKKEILTLYCNEIYLGQRGDFIVRGVAQAADAYFGKELKDLTLAEAAVIAGMIKSPKQFSPSGNLAKSIERRNTVLAAMVSTGKITADEAAAAVREEIKLAPLETIQTAIAPHYLDYVRRLVETELPSDDPQKLAKAAVHTTIDLELQRSAQGILDAQLEKLAPLWRKRNLEPQGALVALDPHTGNILALVGGSNYSESQLNRAVDARRQPGSIFKPIVAATAFESGVSPLARFIDAPMEFTMSDGTKYRPENYGKKYTNESVTLRTALVKSLNTVTVELAMQTGIARIARKAEEFGLPQIEKAYPSMALGAIETSPVEVAAAYALFANGGVRIKPRVVTTTNNDSALESSDENTSKTRVIEPETAYMVTDALSDVIQNGTAKAARSAFKDLAVAGKTGTSRDGWFVGYTPNLVVAVWVGFDGNEDLGLTGAESALPIWTEFVSQTVEARPEFGGKAFPIPAGIVFAEVDPTTGKTADEHCPARVRVAINAKFAPLAECYEHKPIPEFSQEVILANNATLHNELAETSVEASKTINSETSRNTPSATAAAKPQPFGASTDQLQKQMNTLQLHDERVLQRRRREAEQSIY